MFSMTTTMFVWIWNIW